MPNADEILDFGVRIPATVYRVSKSRYPSMQAPPLNVQGTGRFDDPRENPDGGVQDFGVLYCGESAAASFIEILATLRERLTTVSEIHQATMMDVEEREATDDLLKRARNAVLDHWQSEWVLTSAALELNAPLFDLANPGAVQFLRERMSLTLLYMKISDSISVTCSAIIGI